MEKFFIVSCDYRCMHIYFPILRALESELDFEVRHGNNANGANLADSIVYIVKYPDAARGLRHGDC
jgi:hypothetical protein